MGDIITDFLIPIGMILMISIACSMFRKGNDFSMNVFLASMAIGISTLTWTGLLPSYMIIIAILIMSGMFFSEKSGDVVNE